MTENRRKWLDSAAQYGFIRFFVYFSLAEIAIFVFLLNIFDLSGININDMVSLVLDMFSLIIGTILLYSCYQERYLKNQECFVFSELLFWLNFQFMTNILHTLCNGNAELRLLLFCNNMFSDLISVVMLVVFYRFVAGVGKKPLSTQELLLKIGAGIAGLLMIINLFIRLIFYVDENGIYHRAATYDLWTVLTLAMAFVLVYNICIQNISKLEKTAFVLYIALPYVGNLLYSYAHFPFIQYQCVLVASLFIYVKIFVSRTYSLAEQTQINTRQQMQLMTSQIQPHFIFNALSSIRQISKDKETADLILDFSNYLRMNLETLSNDNCVSFEKELEHTKQYLRIEQLRFGQRLSVDFDLQCTDFEIPPLTLQPIVENAIKHGILEKIDGGLVRIASAIEGDGSVVITVTDDGVGFDPGKAADDGKIHVGIENVRARLERLVGGSLTIESEIGKGTKVQILIPGVYGRIAHENTCG